MSVGVSGRYFVPCAKKCAVVYRWLKMAGYRQIRMGEIP